MAEQLAVFVRIEDHWLPPYRIEYDGKYITLFGRDKNYEIPYYGGKPNDAEPEYEEMVLVPVVIEKRDLAPEIVRHDEKKIIIGLYYYKP